MTQLTQHTGQYPVPNFAPSARRIAALVGLVVLIVPALGLPEMALAQPGGPNTGLYSSPEIRSFCAAPTNTSAGSVLDGSLTAMKARLDTLGATMATRAQTLMMSLLLLDLVIRFGRFAIRGDPLEVMMQDWAYALGFVIVAWGMAEVIPDVVNWLAGLALEYSSAAGASDVRPSGVLTGGIRRALCWLDLIRFTSPGTWFYIFAAAISLVTLAVSVAMLVIAYAELYLVGLAGIITVGFAGLAQTQSLATGFFMKLIGKAMKLFGILVVIAATGEITTAIAKFGTTGFVAGFEAAMTIILLQIITGLLVIVLPGQLEQLVAGAKLSSGAAESAGRKTADLGTAGVKTAGGYALGKAGALAQKGKDAVKGRIP